jgi:hypothetical protein
MQIMSIPELCGQFLHGLFFKMICATLIISSNGPGDVSARLMKIMSIPGL